MNPVGNAWTKLESKAFIRVESAFQSRTHPATAAFCSAPERLLWTGQAKINVASCVKEPRELIGEDIEIAHRLACGRSVSDDNGRSRGEHLIELLGEFLGEAHFGCEIVW
jgi:hypothetical protein